MKILIFLNFDRVQIDLKDILMCYDMLKFLSHTSQILQVQQNLILNFSMLAQSYRNCSTFVYRKDYIGSTSHYSYVLWIEIRVKSVEGYSFNNVIYISLAQPSQDFTICSILSVVRIIFFQFQMVSTQYFSVNLVIYSSLQYNQLNTCKIVRFILRYKIY